MKKVLFGIVFAALAAAAFAGCRQITGIPKIDSACCVNYNAYVPEEGNPTRGAYAACVANAAFELADRDELSEDGGREAVRTAANSEVNMPNRVPASPEIAGLAALGLVAIASFLALGIKRMEKK